MEKPEGEFTLPGGQDDKLRVFLGYAGWSKNQLEKEIALNSWLVIKPHPELLRADADDNTWRRIMNGLGPMYRVLADAPSDPSQN
jgi:putative transcriptional regulator